MADSAADQDYLRIQQLDQRIQRQRKIPDKFSENSRCLRIAFPGQIGYSFRADFPGILFCHAAQH